MTEVAAVTEVGQPGNPYAAPIAPIRPLAPIARIIRRRRIAFVLRAAARVTLWWAAWGLAWGGVMILIVAALMAPARPRD